MVHELTHVIEGTSRHSASGVMKAHWDPHGYRQMQRVPLPFAAEDIELIHAGMRARAAAGSGSGSGSPLGASVDAP